jgi:hypothetical protein
MMNNKIIDAIKQAHEDYLSLSSLKGGSNSGNFGHLGIPGKQGGSAAGSSSGSTYVKKADMTVKKLASVGFDAKPVIPDTYSNELAKVTHEVEVNRGGNKGSKGVHIFVFKNGNVLGLFTRREERSDSILSQRDYTVDDLHKLRDDVDSYLSD